jgi:hypothetical protein
MDWFRRAVSSGDVSELQRAAHQLKGTVRRRPRTASSLVTTSSRSRVVCCRSGTAKPRLRSVAVRLLTRALDRESRGGLDGWGKRILLGRPLRSWRVRHATKPPICRSKGGSTSARRFTSPQAGYVRREPPCSDIGLTARRRRARPPTWLAVTFASSMDRSVVCSNLIVHSVAHTAVRGKVQFPASGTSTDARK